MALKPSKTHGHPKISPTRDSTRDRWSVRKGSTTSCARRWVCQREQGGLLVGLTGCGEKFADFHSLETHNCKQKSY